MTKVILLEELKKAEEHAVRDIILPTKIDKKDIDRVFRDAEVHNMRLPDSNSVTKKAPYILNQLITGRDIQTPGQYCEAFATVRSIYCVFDDTDEEEGAMMLLNLMERVRIDLLKSCVIGNQFELDLEQGIETLIYPDNTAPYFAGEMITNWKLPPVKREVLKVWQ